MANVISFYSDELLSAFLKLGLSLLFAYLGKIDLADHLHNDRSSIIGCNDLKSSTTPRRWSRRNGLTTRSQKASSFSAEGLDCQNLLPTPTSSSRAL